MGASGGEAQANGAGALVPVGEVKSSLPSFKSTVVESQTRKVGLIYPPPDIRAIADKTAAFVAKNGPAFEKRIIANESGNTKFSFLNPTDPYHAYYQHKLEEVAAPASATGAPAAAPAPQPLPAAASRPAPAPAAPAEKPEEAQYTVTVPEGLSAAELDIIRLTAQFAARNGKAFLTGLASREHASPAFNFLRPSHSLFGLFTALCDAYSRVLMPPKGLAERLKKDARDRPGALSRCLERLRWERSREAEASQAADAAEAERLAMLSIDWHDFAVVETIDFYEDELEDLPEPLDHKEYVRLTRAGAAAAALQEAQEARERAAGAGMDAEEAALVAQGTAAPEQAPPSPPRRAPASPAASDGDVDMEESEEEDMGSVRVVKNYKRPSAPPPSAAAQMVASPFTGELLRAEDMAEHMRVSLLDPRWREQRERMLAKVRGSVRASDEEISANLSRLAQVRPDVFAGEGAALGDALSEHMGAQGRLPIGAARAEAPREAASADAPPLPPAVPPAKRQRTLPLLPEAEFLADRGAQAQVLRVQAAPECGGQALQLPLDSLLLSVGVLKAMLGGLVGLPAPRLQLRVAGEEGAPLPDEQTLAALNVDQDIELELSRSA